MTQRYLHACEYAGVKEIRAGIKEAKKLKKNLYSNVIPFKSDTIHLRTATPIRTERFSRVTPSRTEHLTRDRWPTRASGTTMTDRVSMTTRPVTKA